MYEASAGGGGTIDENAAGMADSVSYLRDAVKSGDLYMDQEAANRLKKGMQALQDRLDNVQASSHIISQEPSIGDTPKTKVYKPFFASIATDPDQGLLPQIDKMQHDVQEIIDNIDACVRDMRQTDEGGAQGMGGVMAI
jgi:hypothetical protein